jgi:hypothetical protein
MKEDTLGLYLFCLSSYFLFLTQNTNVINIIISTDITFIINFVLVPFV